MIGVLTVPGRAQDVIASGEVIVELFDGEFGVGGQVRPGDWAGIRLRITDSAAEPRELLLRVAGSDPDGDTPMFESVVASSPGTSRDAWVYVRLPSRLGGSVLVTAYEAIATDDEQRPYRAGERLGGALLRPRAVRDPTTGLYAVLNSRGGLGLTQYAVRAQNEEASPLANERTEIVTQLGAEMLPDRWMGLEPFEVVVWGDADPLQLGTERPRAIMEWVARGGHLVIALPALAQEWTNPRSNPLAELLPRVTIQPVAPSYDLNRLGPLFMGREARESEGMDLSLPDASVVVRELVADPLAREREAIPILTDPDGRVLVSRRLVGQGMVTLIGIDFNARPFLRHSLPQAEVFWNRVLGRRGAYRSIAELTNQSTEVGKLRAMTRDRQERWYDDDVGDEIATSGRSAAALLLGFIAFSLYWLVAGPLGYAVLKRYGLVRHAWLGYLAAGGVFTLLAWSGAIALRPKSVSARHLSIIDHVYEQPVQRARSWMSLLIPWYGDATVRVDSTEGFHNMVAPWSPRDGGATAVFPDARGYAIDARDPNTMSFPTRATVKQLDAIWTGEPLEDWRMPRPVLSADQQGEPTLTVDSNGRAVGVLRHDLPGELTDVLIVTVRGQALVGSPSAEDVRGPMLFVSNAASRNAWAPGAELDLSTLDAWEPFGLTLDRMVPDARGISVTDPDPLFGDLEDRLRALSFFHLLEPPVFTPENTRGGTLPRRWQTHGWDLSRWLSQPCVIVVGVLRDSPMPVPMTIGSGREIASRGTTLVRWVYPLEGNPPGWSAAVVDGGSGSGETGSGDASSDENGGG